MVYYTEHGLEWTRAQKLLSPWSLDDATLPAQECFTNPEVLYTPLFRAFMEAPLHRHDWLSCWPLGIITIFSPSPLSEGLRDDIENFNPWTPRWSGYWGNQPPSEAI